MTKPNPETIARRAAELRQNLLRRKQQQQARHDCEPIDAAIDHRESPPAPLPQKTLEKSPAQHG